MKPAARENKLSMKNSSYLTDVLRGIGGLTVLVVVENCGIKRNFVKGFRLKCDKCGSEEVEIINHRACEMAAECGNHTIEAHCLICDSTALVIE